MEKTGWKILAVTSTTMLLALIGILIWGTILNAEYEEKVSTCYYDICSGYEDAWFDQNVCYCYAYDVLGNEVVDYTEYMG